MHLKQAYYFPITQHRSFHFMQSLLSSFFQNPCITSASRSKTINKCPPQYDRNHVKHFRDTILPCYYSRKSSKCYRYSKCLYPLIKTRIIIFSLLMQILACLAISLIHSNPSRTLLIFRHYF